MTTAVSPAALMTSVAHDRLAEPRERLGDDEVDARLGGPADLLLEHRAHVVAGLVAGPDVRVADVAGEQRAGLGGDVVGQPERGPVDLSISPRGRRRAASRGARST